MNLEAARSHYKEAKELADLVSSNWERHYNAVESADEICERDKSTGEITPIIIIKPECAYHDAQLVEKMPVIFQALMLLLKESFDEIRRLRPAPQPPRNKSDYAAECAMMCSRGDFRNYLVACHALDVADDERVKTRVRSILKIKSRGELNDDPDAARRWQDLRRNFNAWVKR